MLISQLNLPKNPTDTPVNMIFTGVAGTGKTHLMQQIAKQNYTIIHEPIDKQNVLEILLSNMEWRDVVALVLLDNLAKGKALLKAPEIANHIFFKTKIQLNQLDNKNVWVVLQQYSNPKSKTVNVKQRFNPALFDKDESSYWYLMDESLSLLHDLQQKLHDYHQAINNQQITTQQNYTFVSFHQAYGYEEFVEGIRPKINDKGQMTYSVEKGVFFELCQKAKKHPNQRFAIFIDEINRANVAKVFGELMSLIEPSKRAGQKNALSVNLAYSGQAFSVPSNMDIFATMNSQDHSLTPLDMAFRRRFLFVECLPKPELLGKIVVGEDEIDLAKLLEKLNDKIIENLGKDSQLGHSFLWEIDTLDKLANAFLYSIMPQIAQNCQNNGQIMQQIFGKNFIEIRDNATKNQYFVAQTSFHINEKALFDVKNYLL